MDDNVDDENVKEEWSKATESLKEMLIIFLKHIFLFYKKENKDENE